MDVRTTFDASKHYIFTLYELNIIAGDFPNYSYGTEISIYWTLKYPKEYWTLKYPKE
jgi:hypothetical protein